MSWTNMQQKAHGQKGNTMILYFYFLHDLSLIDRKSSEIKSLDKVVSNLEKCVQCLRFAGIYVKFIIVYNVQRTKIKTNPVSCLKETKKLNRNKAPLLVREGLNKEMPSETLTVSTTNKKVSPHFKIFMMMKALCLMSWI